MSFGIFEAAVSSDQEQGIARQASVDAKAAAVYDVREALGPVLFASKSVEEFRNKSAMMRKDGSVHKLIEPHLPPVTGVVRSIIGNNGELEKEFKALLMAGLNRESAEHQWGPFRHRSGDDVEPIEPPTPSDEFQHHHKVGPFHVDWSAGKDVKKGRTAADDCDDDDDDDEPFKKKDSNPFGNKGKPKKKDNNPFDKKNSDDDSDDDDDDSPPWEKSSRNLHSEVWGATDEETGNEPGSWTQKPKKRTQPVLSRRHQAEIPGLYDQSSNSPNYQAPGGRGEGATPEEMSAMPGNGLFANRRQAEQWGDPDSWGAQGGVDADAEHRTHRKPSEDDGHLGHEEEIWGPNETLHIKGRRRRAELEGEVKVKSTFKPSDDLLEPEDNWEGYRNKVDQNSDKVKKLFASTAFTVYADWCEANRAPVCRVASLDAYSANLDDATYMKLAQAIQMGTRTAQGVGELWNKWQQDHTGIGGDADYEQFKQQFGVGDRAVNKLKQQHQQGPIAMANRRRGNGIGQGITDFGQSGGGSGGASIAPWDPSDNSVMDSLGDATGLSSPGKTDPQSQQDTLNAFKPVTDAASKGSEISKGITDAFAGKHGKRDPLHAYIAWCKKNGYKRISAKNVDIYSRGNPRLAMHLAVRMKAAIHTARVRQAGGHDLSWNNSDQVSPYGDALAQGPYAEPKLLRKENPSDTSEYAKQEPYWQEPGGKHRPENVRGANRRQAAPDYLQKADDALTQLLNQKAEEFQETIAPLQQALQTVQQATALQQQQNPMNVMPPAGTVNVMPGGDPGTAAQVGMPDPNAPDTSALVQALAGGGGAPGGGGMPNGAAGPPPAAGGPPDPSQQLQARRRRAADWPEDQGTQGHVDRLHNYYRQHPDEHPPYSVPADGPASGGGQGKGRGASSPRLAADKGQNIVEETIKNNWRQMDSAMSLNGYKWDAGGNAWQKPGHKPIKNHWMHTGTAHEYDPSNPDQIFAPARGHGWDHDSGPSGKPYVRPQPDEDYEGHPTPHRHEASQKQAWSGWGPSQFPKARKVAGWEWNDYLNGYKSNSPRQFECACGDPFPAPSGFHRCACGKQWNSYVIGSGGNHHEAAAEQFLVREIPTRENVIVANRQLEATWSQTGQGSWQHSDGGEIHPSKEKAGHYQLYGPTVAMQGGNGPLAPMKQPHPDPKHLMDWYSWSSGEGPRPKGTGFLGSRPPNDILDRWEDHPSPPGYDEWTSHDHEHHYDAHPHPDKRPKSASIELVDPRTGAIHNLVEPGELGEGEDDGLPKPKKMTKDWHHRDKNQRWTS